MTVAIERKKNLNKTTTKNWIKMYNNEIYKCGLENVIIRSSWLYKLKYSCVMSLLCSAVLHLSEVYLSQLCWIWRFLLCRFSSLHQSLPPGERDLCGQEEDQVSEEVSGSSLQPGPGLLWKPTRESGAGETRHHGFQLLQSVFVPTI